VIIHHPDRDRWVSVDRRTVEDSRLSWKARGLLVYLLSKPHNWVVYTAELTNASPGGRDAVLTGLRELELFGYIVRKRLHDEASGQWDSMDVRVFERPQTDFPFVVADTTNGFPVGGKPVYGKSAQSNEGLKATTERSDESPFAPTAVDAVDNFSLRQALLEACGTDPSKCSKRELESAGVAARSILAAGGTAADVPRAVDGYRAQLAGKMMTPHALSNRWSQYLGHSATVAASTPISDAERFATPLARSSCSDAQLQEDIDGQFADDPDAHAEAVRVAARIRSEEVFA